MTQWAFIMLASLCGALAFFLNESKQEVSEWRQKAELRSGELTRLKDAFAQREAKLAELTREISRQRKQLKEAMRDEKVAEWGAAPVPDAVGRVLKGE